METRLPSRLVSVIALTMLTLSVLYSPSSQAASGFQFLRQRGPYAVGLKVVEQYDTSRTFPRHDADGDPAHAQSAGPRPLQTLIWYPASGPEGRAMTVGDYARLAETEVHVDPPHQPHPWETKLAASASVPLWAQRDAAMAAGRFPLVVYAPGQSSVAWDNADLCEYLASHGYVVIASPSLGKSTREADDNLDDIDAEAADISFLISYAKTLPNVDVSSVAVAGWSWGGIANLFAATRDDRIKALVALDGSMRYYPGLIRKSGAIHPERMTIPLLFFTRGNLSLEDWNRYAGPDNEGPSVLNAWTHGDLVTIHMLGMSHTAFASMYQRASNDKKFAENQMDDYDRDDVNVSYAWVARYTLGFLDANLKRDAAEMRFLKAMPAEHGVPRHFMTVDYRAATSTP